MRHFYHKFVIFQVVNHHLLRDLVERGLWSDDMKNELIVNNGSVQVFSSYIQLS